MDYERDKRIDLNNLHYEWIRQVEITHKYEEEVARAKFEVDRIEELVEVEEALAGKRARDNLTTRGGKFTVDMVRDEVSLDPELSKRKEEHRQAVLELGLIRAAAKAIDVRKSALENLVELYKREYFAVPYESKDYGDWNQKRFTEDTTEVLRNKANEKAKEAIIRTRTKRS